MILKLRKRKKPKNASQKKPRASSKKTSKKPEKKKNISKNTALELNEEVSYRGPYKKPLAIASYYGFKCIRPLGGYKKYVKDVENVLGNSAERLGKKEMDLLSEKVALIRLYISKELSKQPQPVNFAFIDRRGAREQNLLKLVILGSNKSVCEILAIHVALVVLKESGHKNLKIELNSAGDKDSSEQFFREFTLYYRKNLNALSADSRQIFKEDPLRLLTENKLIDTEISEKAPRSISFLSETSRAHFKEVLEYLETVDAPYKINPRLVGNKNFFSETIFQINSTKNKNRSNENTKEEVLAFGSRCEQLGKKFGAKRNIPLVQVSIKLKPSKTKDVYTLSKNSQKKKNPQVYLIQIGSEAKLANISLFEELRKAKIPIVQSLYKDKLSLQLSAAERFGSSFVLLIGQKEAIDNTVIVRNTKNNSQETVDRNEVVKYLKKALLK